MARSIRLSIAAAVLGGVALVVGFWVFARAVQQAAPTRVPHADAIVVLTGGEDRIETGIRLLSEGVGRRLLISGMHPTAGAAEISRITGRESNLVSCCVDFGYTALDTSGNAEEARRWVEGRGFSRLILVTSTYHMPRSLAEFARVLPDIEIVAYPVRSRHYRLDTWWQHRPTARLLILEYLKFLTASARLGMARLVGPWERRSLAASPNKPGSI
jgi:uncharacterized SAM-binding protein YcdF (DUF218 family)